MEISIKRAALADLELLVQWRMEVLREVFQAAAVANFDSLEQANRAYYQTALRDESHIACFALHEGEAIGCGGVCLYRELPSPDVLDGRCGYLMNIYTRPPFRGQGVGEKVVRWLVGQAQNRNASKIHLEATAGGYALYRRLGFVPMGDQMIFQATGMI